MEPVTAISSLITTAQASLRLAREIAKRVKNTELTEKLQEAFEVFGDIRQQVFVLEDENRQLKTENAQLKNIDDFKKTAEFDKGSGVYWCLVNGKREGPYCPLCLDDTAKPQIVPLRDLRSSLRGHFCEIHQRSFGGGSGFGVATPKPSRFMDEF
jgi:hypothetical protein